MENEAFAQKNARFSIIFSNTEYFKGVKRRYYGVKVFNFAIAELFDLWCTCDIFIVLSPRCTGYWTKIKRGLDGPGSPTEFLALKALLLLGE